MNFERIVAIFLRQYFIIRRSFMRIFTLFYWSTIEVFLWGIITIYLDRVANANLHFLAMMLGIVILWNFLLRTQQGSAVPFLEDVWTRNFINLFSSPLRISEYIAGHVLISMLTTAAALVLLALLSWALFAYNILFFGFALVPYIAVLFLFGIALGIATTAIVLRFGPAAQDLVWSLPFLLAPFSGVFHPVSALPQALQPIAAILPSAYIFEGMRNVVLTGAFDTPGLFIALALSVVYGAIAYATLIWAFRYVLRHGLFTRFLTD